MKRTSAPRPVTPLDEFYRSEAAIPKQRLGDEPIDTRSLKHAKEHPLRDREFLTWLRRKPCAVAGLVDGATGQPHVCWSPEEWRRGVYVSDPCHCGKAFSGQLKRSDAEAWPLCRHGHRDSELNMDSFDMRFSVDRFEIAAKLRTEFLREQEKSNGR